MTPPLSGTDCSRKRTRAIEESRKRDADNNYTGNYKRTRCDLGKPASALVMGRPTIHGERFRDNTVYLHDKMHEGYRKWKVFVEKLIFQEKEEERHRHNDEPYTPTSSIISSIVETLLPSNGNKRSHQSFSYFISKDGFREDATVDDVRDAVEIIYNSPPPIAVSAEEGNMSSSKNSPYVAENYFYANAIIAPTDDDICFCNMFLGPINNTTRTQEWRKVVKCFAELTAQEGMDWRTSNAYNSIRHCLGEHQRFLIQDPAGGEGFQLAKEDEIKQWTFDCFHVLRLAISKKAARVKLARRSQNISRETDNFQPCISLTKRIHGSHNSAECAFTAAGGRTEEKKSMAEEEIPVCGPQSSLGAMTQAGGDPTPADQEQPFRKKVISTVSITPQENDIYLPVNGKYSRSSERTRTWRNAVKEAARAVDGWETGKAFDLIKTRIGEPPPRFLIQGVNGSLREATDDQILHKTKNFFKKIRSARFRTMTDEDKKIDEAYDNGTTPENGQNESKRPSLVEKEVQPSATLPQDRLKITPQDSDVCFIRGGKYLLTEGSEQYKKTVRMVALAAKGWLRSNAYELIRELMGHRRYLIRDTHGFGFREMTPEEVEKRTCGSFEYFRSCELKNSKKGTENAEAKEISATEKLNDASVVTDDRRENLSPASEQHEAVGSPEKRRSHLQDQGAYPKERDIAGKAGKAAIDKERAATNVGASATCTNKFSKTQEVSMTMSGNQESRCNAQVTVLETKNEILSAKQEGEFGSPREELSEENFSAWLAQKKSIWRKNKTRKFLQLSEKCEDKRHEPTASRIELSKENFNAWLSQKKSLWRNNRINTMVISESSYQNRLHERYMDSEDTAPEMMGPVSSSFVVEPPQIFQTYEESDVCFRKGQRNFVTLAGDEWKRKIRMVADSVSGWETGNAYEKIQKLVGKQRFLIQEGDTFRTTTDLEIMQRTESAFRTFRRTRFKIRHAHHNRDSASAEKVSPRDNDNREKAVVAARDSSGSPAIACDKSCEDSHSDFSSVPSSQRSSVHALLLLKGS